MKLVKVLTIGLLGILCFSTSSRVTAQNNYEQTMQSLKLAYEAAKTKADFVELKNKYNRVAAVETQEWLPCYYEILCTLAWAFEESDDVQKAKLANQIDLMINELETITGDNVEVLVLRGRLLQLKSGIPTENRMQIGLALFETIGGIVQKYPDNPRGLLLMGEIIIYSPKNFMGYSHQQGLDYIRRSAALLKEVKHTDSIYPSWGYDIAQGYLSLYDPQEKATEPTPATAPTPAAASPAQGSRDKVLESFYDTDTPLDFAAEEAQFAQLIAKDPNNYVWHYHRAFCLVQLAYNAKDAKLIDEYCDRAETALKDMPADVPQDELLCLQALVKVTRIKVDYNSRGLPYYIESESLLDQAIKINPANPRAHYLKGQNQRYLPKDFGGGMASAKVHFEKSKDLFENQSQPDNGIRWGYGEVSKILAKI